MSYRTIASTDSENEHFSESIDMRPKNKCEKTHEKKQNKMNASYRDNVTERLRSEEFDVELINSLTFRQGDCVVTIKTPFEEKGKELWVIAHYKVANIENVPVKDRWKFSEATVRLYTSDESKDQTLHTGLNETMQTIFDKLLTDPKRQTIKSKKTV
ncbi:unnamed protein product [Macrosiphum euphorbiae]|uniref:Uncharacterized protein n=1 Tax=Macrosiphum euphorbiae TaxID=13131 RepID=A0AAV0XEE8_9HEMI|nr:unnamed protein product [Macrosiphum euphorbiae]